MSTKHTDIDDEGEVDADGEVGDGEHVRRRLFQEFQGLDEPLKVCSDPAHRYHGRLRHNHELIQQATGFVEREETVPPSAVPSPGFHVETVVKGERDARGEGVRGVSHVA